MQMGYGVNPDAIKAILSNAADGPQFLNSCSQDLCAAAAGHGHLAILKWMRSVGCPWDAEKTFREACIGRYGWVPMLWILIMCMGIVTLFCGLIPTNLTFQIEIQSSFGHAWVS